MTHEVQAPRRFGTYASVIQLLAYFVTASPDGGATAHTVTIASFLFWIFVVVLLSQKKFRASRAALFFLRWGLVPFVLIGALLIRPIVDRPLLDRWVWLDPLLLFGMVLLHVGALMYLFTRIFRVRSPFDELRI